MRGLAFPAAAVVAAVGCGSAPEPRMGVWGPLIVPGRVLSGPFAFHGVTFFFDTDEIPQLVRRGDDEILGCGPFSVGFRIQVGAATGSQLFWLDGRKHLFPLGSHVYLFRPDGTSVTVRYQGRTYELIIRGDETPHAAVEPSGVLTWYGEPVGGSPGGRR